MTNQHYINGKDVFTQWGIVITSIQGLDFPKRKTAYYKSWEGYTGADAIPGGYESREVTLALVVYVSATENPRAKVETFLRDLSAMWEFVLYDVDRKEGVVLRLSDESARNIYNDIANKKVAELSLKLVNDYPCAKTFIATSGAAQTVTVNFKNTTCPKKVFWGDGTSVIARTSSASKSLAAGTWYIVVAENADFNPESSIVGATSALTI
jgi:hypothetical protein